MTSPSLALNFSHSWSSVLRIASNAWIEGGELSTALGVTAGDWIRPADEPTASPGGVTSKPTDVEAMSSSLEVAASSLRMTVVSTLDSSTWMGRRPGPGDGEPAWGIMVSSVSYLRQAPKRAYAPLYKSRQVVHVALCHTAGEVVQSRAAWERQETAGCARGRGGGQLQLGVPRVLPSRRSA